MGGGRGSGYIPPASNVMRRKIEQARTAGREQLDSDVNNLLQDFLIQINDRDVDQTRKRIDDVAEVLADSAEIDTLLFGGSVAKHTYVDGLSDVDALVILDRDSTRGISPQHVLEEFRETLQVGLSRRGLLSVEKGRLAITVRFTDGSEIQLLPAIRSGNTIAIPNDSGRGWNQTNPRHFQRELSRHNERLGGAFLPTIKLIKSLVADLPEQQRITGYHAEALSVEAVKHYDGPNTPRTLLTHILRRASQRVLKPIQDITGQSRTVDDYLGPADSIKRRLTSQALAGVARRLEAATSVGQWRAMFGGTR